MGFLLIIIYIKKKTRRGKTDWQAGHGWTGHKAYIKQRQTNMELQTQGDYKGTK